MDAASVPGVERELHGGSHDDSLLDFSDTTNPDRPPGVAGVFESSLSASRTYPHDDYSEFRTAAAEHVGCAPYQVIPAAGAMGGIRLAFGVSVSPGDRVLVPEPTFSEYAREVRLQGGRPAFVPEAEVPEADPSSYDVAVLCTPNNPTGRSYPPHELGSFLDRCREAGTPLVVDETYTEFSAAPSLAGRDGVVVLRSLTRVFGLPGLRAGYLVATESDREVLERARPVWGLSTPAAQVATHCLRQREFVADTRDRVREERARLASALADGFDVAPSDAPFLLLDVGDRDVQSVLDAARSEGILLRDATTFRGLDSHVRVGVRRPDENERLLSVLTAL